MANKYIFNMGFYGGSTILGIAAYAYYGNKDKNMTMEEKYAKYGGDRRKLMETTVEDKAKNALLFKKIRENAGIKEEELPKPESAQKEKKLLGRMEGRKKDVLAARKKLQESEESLEEEKPVKKKKRKKKRAQETTEEGAGAAIE